MPAKSVAQRRLFAIAEHNPDKLRNTKILGSMPKSEMHDYASTPEKGLPERKETVEKAKALRKK